MPTQVSALASRPESLNFGAMSELVLDRSPVAGPLDREALLARFDGIRRFGPRASRCCSSMPSRDRQTEIRFNATEAILNPLQIAQDVDTAGVRPNAHGLEA